MTSTMQDVDSIRVSRELPGRESLHGARTSPIVDPRGATFVYHGKADEVRWRCWLRGLAGSQPLQRLDATDTWALRIELPAGSRIEYKLEVENDGRAEWLLDPLNPVTASDPFGANSVCQGYGYVRPDWTIADPVAPGGTVDELSVHSKQFDETRGVG